MRAVTISEQMKKKEILEQMEKMVFAETLISQNFVDEMILSVLTMSFEHYLPILLVDDALYDLIVKVFALVLGISVGWMIITTDPTDYKC